MAAIPESDPYNTSPTAYEHLIRPDLVGLEGLGHLADEIREHPGMRAALLLRATTVLRERLQKLDYQASTAEPVTIEAQDALVLLDLLLRRLS